MKHQDKNLVGRVTDIFAHRFVVQTPSGKILADLTPKGAERIALKEGDQVEITGEMKPSELKVRSIARNGASAIIIDHPPKPHKPHPYEPADPAPALKTAGANGVTVLGEPRRKPKHFEILGRDRGGDIVELHIELDGELRKRRVVHESDPKWASELEAAR